MTQNAGANAGSQFMRFVEVVVDGDFDAAIRALEADPSLVTIAATVGATRQQSAPYFFERIAHYLYAGDTALHMAAAAFQPKVTALLIRRGADCRARNRRGAEPLHYAADANSWNPRAQARTIACLLKAGADPNARDGSGVTPLLRAVRTRSSAAVKALLDGGADPRRPNRNGSTPMDLANRPTGRSGSGSPHSREEQAVIVQLLTAHRAVRRRSG